MCVAIFLLSLHPTSYNNNIFFIRSWTCKMCVLLQNLTHILWRCFWYGFEKTRKRPEEKIVIVTHETSEKLLLQLLYMLALLHWGYIRWWWRWYLDWLLIQHLEILCSLFSPSVFSSSFMDESVPVLINRNYQSTTLRYYKIIMKYKIWDAHTWTRVLAELIIPPTPVSKHLYLMITYTYLHHSSPIIISLHIHSFA